MNNPTTIDRRDVAHPTDPLGADRAIEAQDLGETDESATGAGDAAANPPEADRESLAYPDVQQPNLPDGSTADDLKSLEQPVEGSENGMRINPRTGLPELIEPGS
jgi:hypothetical protein